MFTYRVEVANYPGCRKTGQIDGLLKARRRMEEESIIFVHIRRIESWRTGKKKKKRKTQKKNIPFDS